MVNGRIRPPICKCTIRIHSIVVIYKIHGIKTFSRLQRNRYNYLYAIYEDEIIINTIICLGESVLLILRKSSGGRFVCVTATLRGVIQMNKITQVIRRRKKPCEKKTIDKIGYCGPRTTTGRSVKKKYNISPNAPAYTAVYDMI